MKSLDTPGGRCARAFVTARVARARSVAVVSMISAMRMSAGFNFNSRNRRSKIGTSSRSLRR
jgi:hypothetical protein